MTVLSCEKERAQRCGLQAMTVVRDAATGASKRGPRKAERGTGGLALRVVSGVFAIPFLLGVAYFGALEPGKPGWLAYGLVICFASGFAAFEVRTMLRSGGYAPMDAVLIGLAVLLPLNAWLRPSADV